MACISTMKELSRRWKHRKAEWSDKCLLCGEKDTRVHAWLCNRTRAYPCTHLKSLDAWLKTKWYKEEQGLREESRGPKCWVVWSVATKTEGFQVDKLSAAKEGSLGVQFLREAVTASMQLYEHRAKEREKAMRLRMNTTQTVRQVMVLQLRRWDKGEEESEDDGQEDQDIDREGSDTARKMLLTQQNPHMEPRCSRAWPCWHTAMVRATKGVASPHPGYP